MAQMTQKHPRKPAEEPANKPRSELQPPDPAAGRRGTKPIPAVEIPQVTSTDGTATCYPEPLSATEVAFLKRVNTPLFISLRVPLLFALRDGEWHFLSEMAAGKAIRDLLTQAVVSRAAKKYRKPKSETAEYLVRQPLIRERMIGRVVLEQTGGRWRARLVEPRADPRFVIDPEFQALVPTFDPDKLLSIAYSILGVGFGDPYRVWTDPVTGTTTLLDHHIWAEFEAKYPMRPDLATPPRLMEIKLPNRAAAKEWIARHQLSLRHQSLTALATSYLRGAIYNARKRPQGGGRPSATRGQNALLRTAVVLAHEYHVASRTIQRDGKLAASLDQLAAEVNEKEKGAALQVQRIAVGHARWTHEDITRLMDLEPEVRAAVAREAVMAGQRPRLPKPPIRTRRKLTVRQPAAAPGRTLRLYSSGLGGKT